MRHSVHILLVWILLIFAKSSFAQTINPYQGGSADGHSTTELINQAVEPPVHFNAYFGGSGDGHHTDQLINYIIISPIHFTPYFGGSGDGHHSDQLINQVFTSPIHFTPYFGGTGDGYDSAQLVAHVFVTPSHFNAFFGGSGDGQDMDGIEVVLPPVDPLPPDIECPANISVNTLPGQCYAQPNTGTATATDNAPGIITIAGIRSDGQLLNANYPKGQTTITWTATDVAENSSTCTQTVTVTDVEKPVIDFCPVNKTVNTLATAATCSIYVADADLGVATAHDNCGAVTISRQGVPAGNIFPAGETTITYSFTDASGNAITCIQKITVTDLVKPTIDFCPANKTVNTLPTSTTCSIYISDADLGVATAHDNCGVVTISRQGVPAGNIFPVGETIITYNFADASNNAITCTQKITVLDKTKPVIACPQNVTVNTTAGACNAIVSVAAIGTPVATDYCGGAVNFIATGVPAGNVFPLGVTTLTWSATDASGNISTCTQKITVQDKTKPVITCPANIVVNAAAGQCYALILPASLGIASAIDNCNGNRTVSRSSLPANNKYPVGITTITYTARDAANNTVTCTQTITVKDVQPPVISNVSAKPSSLWPADKKMKDVTINYKSSDNCSVTSCVLSVSSSEPVTSKDDKTTPDWQIIDDHRIKLRAERISKTNGRTYTITITCTDKSGNKTTATTKVKVKDDDDDDDDHDHDDHDRPGGTIVAKEPVNETVEGLQVAAYPNPTHNHFRIEIKSNNKKDKIIMQVFDILGRRVELRTNLQTDESIRVGDKYKQGAYFIRVMQANEYKVIKLIKLSD